MSDLGSALRAASSGVSALCVSINGLNNAQVRVKITGQLPEGWLCDSLSAFASTHGDTVVVHAVIAHPVRPGQYALIADTIGMSLETQPAVGLEALAGSIATQALAKIRIARGGIRIALAPGAVMPTRGSEGASGYDLHAISAVRIEPGRIAKIDTGVMLEMPAGMEAQIRPRSGLSQKGIWAALGTVDSDYRGTCGVVLRNHTTDAYTVNVDDRIAQLVFAAVAHPPMELVDVGDLGSTVRGAGGFGSTGT